MLQHPKGLYCEALIGPAEAQTPLLSTTAFLSTTEFVAPYVAEQPTRQARVYAELYFFLGSLQN